MRRVLIAICFDKKREDLSSRNGRYCRFPQAGVPRQEFALRQIDERRRIRAAYSSRYALTKNERTCPLGMGDIAVSRKRESLGKNLPCGKLTNDGAYAPRTHRDTCCQPKKRENRVLSFFGWQGRRDSNNYSPLSILPYYRIYFRSLRYLLYSICIYMSILLFPIVGKNLICVLKNATRMQPKSIYKFNNSFFFLLNSSCEITPLSSSFLYLSNSSVLSVCFSFSSFSS